MLEIKNTVTEMENLFNELISRLDIDDKRIKLKIDQQKFLKQKYKRKMKKTRHSRTVKNFKRCLIGMPEREE